MTSFPTDALVCEEALKAAEDYVLGVATQDRERLTTLFAETAHIVGVDEGKAISIPRDRWINAMCAPERAGQGSRKYQVVAVHLAGDVGVIIVHTSNGRFDYCDVLALLKYDGTTRITQKSFHQCERQA
ncbi:hypothetical protein J2Y48_004418 [Mycoplana sp. BE70]|uniref:nuclear transport factor 2 family protein n=1 Tax=Mycoplana sp. BE70 TaxID=2817775 RepID=UPI00285C9EFD|nr:nuclear transport factor 2 family protein [Mycoplana sp. BE70]MDR6759102.1 hypothetical protein [Mycoplana sp. BE70]